MNEQIQFALPSGCPRNPIPYLLHNEHPHPVVSQLLPPFLSFPPFNLLHLHIAAYTVLWKPKSGHVTSLLTILQWFFILLTIKPKHLAFVHMPPILLWHHGILVSLNSPPLATPVPRYSWNPASSFSSGKAPTPPSACSALSPGICKTPFLTFFQVSV